MGCGGGFRLGRGAARVTLHNPHTPPYLSSRTPKYFLNKQRPCQLTESSQRATQCHRFPLGTGLELAVEFVRHVSDLQRGHAISTSMQSACQRITAM